MASGMQLIVSVVFFWHAWSSAEKFGGKQERCLAGEELFAGSGKSMIQLASSYASSRSQKISDSNVEHGVVLANAPAKSRCRATGSVDNVPLNQLGFNSIQSRCCAPEMAEFIERLIKKDGSTVCNYGSLNGLTSFYDCPGDQLYPDLVADLQSAADLSLLCPWIKSPQASTCPVMDSSCPNFPQAPTPNAPSAPSWPVPGQPPSPGSPPAPAPTVTAPCEASTSTTSTQMPATISITTALTTSTITTTEALTTSTITTTEALTTSTITTTEALTTSTITTTEAQTTSTITTTEALTTSTITATNAQVSTTLASQVNAGDTTLGVASVTNFQAGQGITIDAGTAVEETNVVVGFSSILLQSPLQYSHSPGATVSVIQVTQSTTTTTSGPASTCGGNSNGSPCLFPFSYHGSLHTTCVMGNHNQPWCYTTAGQNHWGNCDCTTTTTMIGGPPTCGGNAHGAPCAFPFTYNGATHSTCIHVDNPSSWCYTTAGAYLWGHCDCTTTTTTVIGTQPTCGGNANEAPCLFPFTYKGAQYTTCIMDDHPQHWCFTTAGHNRWGNCICTTSTTTTTVTGATTTQATSQELFLAIENASAAIAKATSAEQATSFHLGQEVSMRDKGDSVWYQGFVTSVKPLLVRFADVSASDGFEWDEVRQRDQAF